MIAKQKIFLSVCIDNKKQTKCGHQNHLQQTGLIHTVPKELEIDSPNTLNEMCNTPTAIMDS